MAYTIHEWTNVADPQNPGNAVAMSAEILNEMEAGIEGAICREGDVMEGELLLNGGCNSDKAAVPKEYVDNSIKFRLINYNVTPNIKDVIYTIPNFDSNKHIVLVGYYSDLNYTYSDYPIYNMAVLSALSGERQIPIATSRAYDKYIGIKQNGDIFIYTTLSDWATGSVNILILNADIQMIN